MPSDSKFENTITDKSDIQQLRDKLAVVKPIGRDNYIYYNVGVTVFVMQSQSCDMYDTDNEKIKNGCMLVYDRVKFIKPKHAEKGQKKLEAKEKATKEAEMKANEDGGDGKDNTDDALNNWICRTIDKQQQETDSIYLRMIAKLGDFYLGASSPYAKDSNKYRQINYNTT